MKSYPVYSEDPILVSNKQFKDFLNNKKRLDLALNVALGSQAFLHQNSSFDQNSIISCQQLERRFSPAKSAASSLGKQLKKSKFAQMRQKQNSFQGNNNKCEQNVISNNLEIIHKWIQIIQQRSKIFQNFKLISFDSNNSVSNLLSPLKIRTKSNISNQSDKYFSVDKIDFFFKQICYRLDRLQMLERQQYNSKFILCQLTQASFRQQQYQEQIINYNKQVKTKQNKIQELTNKIQNLQTILSHSNYKQKMSKVKIHNQGSYVDLSISQKQDNLNQKFEFVKYQRNIVTFDLENFCIQDENLTEENENSISYINQNNKSSLERSKLLKQIGNKELVKQLNQYILDPTISKLLFSSKKIDSQFGQISQTMLLKSSTLNQLDLKCKQKILNSQQLKYSKQQSQQLKNSEDINFALYLSPSKQLTPNQMHKNCKKCQQFEYLKSQMQYLQHENQQLKLLIHNLETQLEQVKQNYINLNKNQKNWIEQIQILDVSTEKYQIQQSNTQCLFKNQNIQIPNIINEIYVQSTQVPIISVYSSNQNSKYPFNTNLSQNNQNDNELNELKKINIENQNLKLKIKSIQKQVQQILETNQKTKQQANNKQKQNQIIMIKIKQLQAQLQQMQRKYQLKHQQSIKQCLEQKESNKQIILQYSHSPKDQNQDKYIQINSDQFIQQFINQEGSKQIITQTNILQARLKEKYNKQINQNNKQINQKSQNLTTLTKPGQIIIENFNNTINLQDIKCGHKSYKDLRAWLMLVLSHNQKLRLKLAKKKAQLQKIRSVLKQAKYINDKDIQQLQQNIKYRQKSQLKKIQELKQMENKWKQYHQLKNLNRQQKLIQIQEKNRTILLNVNKNRFKFLNKKKQKKQTKKTNISNA